MVIWQVRRGTGLFVLFGQSSLAAWMIENFFNGSLCPAADLFVKGIPKLIGTAAAAGGRLNCGLCAAIPAGEVDAVSGICYNTTIISDQKVREGVES